MKHFSRVAVQNSEFLVAKKIREHMFLDLDWATFSNRIRLSDNPLGEEVLSPKQEWLCNFYELYC